MVNIFERKKDGTLPFKTTSNRKTPCDKPDGLPIMQSQVSQSVGKVRNHNEDAVFSVIHEIPSPVKRQTFGLFMIADGMGGHLDGEVASSLAVKIASNHLLTYLYEPLCLGHPPFTDEEIEAELDHAMHAAQEAVVTQVAGGGTTLTLALVLNCMLYFAHVGDSRLYLMTGNGPLQVLTKDHSLVRRLVDLGQISQQEAASHPQRNVLFRAVGQVEGFKADLGHLELTAKSSLLLCSDGLWGLVNEAAITSKLEKTRRSEGIAQELINAANHAGGTDNISVIIVTIS